MGTVPLSFVKDVLCPTVARTSTPRVANQGKISPELLEGSLGGAKVAGGIATWVYACDQPKRIHPPGSFTLPPQSFSQMLLLIRMGGVRRSALRPRYCRRKNPI